MAVRILLVSGDEAARAPIAEELRDLAWRDGPAEVTEAASGEQALPLAAGRPFDLAVAELVLPRPGISGASTLIRVRELCPRCRTLLVSDHHYVRDLVRDAADRFLTAEGENGEPPDLEDAVAELLPERMQDELATQAVRAPGAREEGAPPPEGAAPSPADDSLPGRAIGGRYRVVARLGFSSGPVFRARKLESGRPVALQLLRLAPEAGAEETAARIAKALAVARRLRHPNVAAFEDAGVDGDDLYVVTELVPGGPLRDLLAPGRALPRDRAIEVALAVLEALGHAHDRGLVHGDLKPANVLVTPEGEVKVADFGLSQLAPVTAAGQRGRSESPEQPSTDAVVLATVGYMAPEQVQSRSVDHRADLFALGAILFEMLHGKALSRVASPFVRAAFLDVDQAPDKLPELPGDRRLSEVLERAVAPSLKRRYASCESFAGDLRAARASGWSRLRRFLGWPAGEGG